MAIKFFKFTHCSVLPNIFKRHLSKSQQKKTTRAKTVNQYKLCAWWKISPTLLAHTITTQMAQKEHLALLKLHHIAFK